MRTPWEESCISVGKMSGSSTCHLVRGGYQCVFERVADVGAGPLFAVVILFYREGGRTGIFPAIRSKSPGGYLPSSRKFAGGRHGVRCLGGPEWRRDDHDRLIFSTGGPSITEDGTRREALLQPPYGESRSPLFGCRFMCATYSLAVCLWRDALVQRLAPSPLRSLRWDDVFVLQAQEQCHIVAVLRVDRLAHASSGGPLQRVDKARQFAKIWPGTGVACDTPLFS